MSEFTINYLTVGTSGQSGGLTSDDDAVAVASIANTSFESGEIQATFRLSGGGEHTARASTTPGSEAVLTWPIGRLDGGTYECTVEVSAELSSTSEYIGQEIARFDVHHATAPEPAAPVHDPNDFRLELGHITMQTEGGGIVHAEDEAFSTETVTYYAEVLNATDHYLGTFVVNFLVDGQNVGHGGSTQLGIDPRGSYWATGSTDTLSVGRHTLEIQVVSEAPDLFVGSSQTIELNVLPPRNPRAFPEGQESEYPGWKQRQVYLYLTDYHGRGINGSAVVEFSGPGGATSERGDAHNGDLTLDSVWAPEREGSMVITINSDVDDMQLRGGGPFDDGEGAISMRFTQAKSIDKVTFSSAEEFNRTIATQVSAGINLKVFSAGAEVSGELAWGTTIHEGIEYEIWTPKPILEAGDFATASQR